MDLCYEAEEILLGYEARRIEDDIDTYLAICSSKYGETEFTGLEGYNLGCITGRTEIYTQDIKTWSAGLEKAEGNIFQRTIAWIKKMFANLWNWIKGIFSGSDNDPAKSKPNKMFDAIKRKAAVVVQSLNYRKERKVETKVDLTGMWTIDMFKACTKLKDWAVADEAASKKVGADFDQYISQRDDLLKTITPDNKKEVEQSIKDLRAKVDAAEDQTSDTDFSKFMKVVNDAPAAAKLLGVSTPTYTGVVTIDDSFINFFQELDKVFPAEFLTARVKFCSEVVKHSKTVESKLASTSEADYKKSPGLAKLDMAIAKASLRMSKENLSNLMTILRKLMQLISAIKTEAFKGKKEAPEAEAATKSNPKTNQRKKKKKGKGGKESYMPTFRSTRLKRLGGTA